MYCFKKNMCDSEYKQAEKIAMGDHWPDNGMGNKDTETLGTNLECVLSKHE